MEKNVISTRQAVNTMILFIFGSTAMMGSHNVAKQDSWMCVILGMVLSIPIFLMYSRIIKLFPQKNLYEIVYEIFGKIGGAIITILFIFYSLQIGSLVMRNFTVFIQVSAFPKTPQAILAVFLGITCLWILKHGVELLGRLSLIFLTLMIIVITTTFVFLMKDMDFSSIKPVGGSGLKTILSGSISAVSFVFGESVLFISLLGSLQKKESPKKVYLVSLIVSAGLIIISTIRNILILGNPTISLLYFPSYSTVSVLNVGDFITRIEVIVAASILACSIIKVCICLYSSTLGLAKILNIENYKLILTPVAFFLIAFSQFGFENAFKMFEFFEVYNYYALIFEIGLPIIILIFAEIKIHKNKKIANAEISYQPIE